MKEGVANQGGRFAEQKAKRDDGQRPGLRRCSMNIGCAGNGHAWASEMPDPAAIVCQVTTDTDDSNSRVPLFTNSAFQRTPATPVCLLLG